MFNTEEEAQQAANGMNENLQYLHASPIMVFKYNFEPKYKVSYFPSEYKDKYNAATYENKALFHYAFYLAFGVMLQDGKQDLYENAEIKNYFDNVVNENPALSELKKYLD